MTRQSQQSVLLARWRRVPRFLAVLAALSGALVGAPTEGADCMARSGAETVALVELYTSEGCDSCPPADRWLSTALPVDGVSKGAVALAFHVDYWDRLGWKDRFAQPAFTERQHAARRANGSGFVYTPQVIVQGRDFPAWRGKSSAALRGIVNAQPARADIVVEANPMPQSVAVKATAHVAGATGARRGALFVALVESGLVSEVRTGENAGKRLVHDHVVRVLSEPIPVDARGDATAELALPRPAEAGRAPTLVAFVQDTGTGDVLQVLALPCPSTRGSP